MSVYARTCVVLRGQLAEPEPPIGRQRHRDARRISAVLRPSWIVGSRPPKSAGSRTSPALDGQMPARREQSKWLGQSGAEDSADGSSLPIRRPRVPQRASELSIRTGPVRICAHSPTHESCGNLWIHARRPDRLCGRLGGVLAVLASGSLSTKRGQVPWSRYLGSRVVIVLIAIVLLRVGVFRAMVTIRIMRGVRVWVFSYSSSDWPSRSGPVCISA